MGLNSFIWSCFHYFPIGVNNIYIMPSLLPQTLTGGGLGGGDVGVWLGRKDMEAEFFCQWASDYLFDNNNSWQHLLLMCNRCLTSPQLHSWFFHQCEGDYLLDDHECWHHLLLMCTHTRSWHELVCFCNGVIRKDKGRRRTKLWTGLPNKCRLRYGEEASISLCTLIFAVPMGLFVIFTFWCIIVLQLRGDWPYYALNQELRVQHIHCPSKST